LLSANPLPPVMNNPSVVLCLVHFCATFPLLPNCLDMSRQSVQLLNTFRLMYATGRALRRTRSPRLPFAHRTMT
jgi:hypothetical protein